MENKTMYTINQVFQFSAFATQEMTVARAVQNVTPNSRPELLSRIQQKIQKASSEVSNHFTKGSSCLCLQNFTLIGTSILCATFLALLIKFFRKTRPAPKYEILLATVLTPNSTPEDVAVNCTLGALSVGKKTNLNHPEVLDMWKKSGSEKKVMAVDSGEILQQLQQLADEKNIVNVLIRDVPTSSHTNTTLAVGPALPQDLAAFASFGTIIGQSKVAP